MKLNRPILIAVILSLLLHIIIIMFVKFMPENKEADNSKNQPVEISVIPKSSLDNEPVPEIIEEEIIDDNAKTTLDHDKSGGKSGGEKDGAESQSSASITKKPKVNINKPKVTSNMEKDLNEDTDNMASNVNLFNNDNILDGILKEKKEKPKGEDTASYNKFEERYASYFSKFRRRVYQLWQYPEQSVARRESGVVKLSFSILKDGSIVNIRMLQSSGYSNLDREVMRVLKNMGKIPLPESYELEQLNVEEAFFIYSMGDDTYRYLQ